MKNRNYKYEVYYRDNGELACVADTLGDAWEYTMRAVGQVVVVHLSPKQRQNLLDKIFKIRKVRCEND